ncbi:hypothetical protein JCM19239_1414 [Vibrio variabilis]|uniref:Uncharacterized protein n=1 Tax=Vibrio variabilis TaxID=990271 RepID=A0ABQ0JPE5_9VIBR|nr:hypothetical protein JCM19239_1414 [Vibrio variabilis]
MNLKQTFVTTSILLAFSAPSFAAIDFYISDIKGEYRSFAINDSSALAVIRANISETDCELDSDGKTLNRGWKNIVVSGDLSGDATVLESLSLRVMTNYLWS